MIPWKRSTEIPEMGREVVVLVDPYPNVHILHGKAMKAKSMGKDKKFPWAFDCDSHIWPCTDDDMWVYAEEFLPALPPEKKGKKK